MKKVLILINEPLPGAGADELDVLTQAAAVETALGEMDYSPEIFPVGLNLEALDRKLESTAPDLVFNLVETLGGKGALIHLVPALLESRHIPFTGTGTLGMYLTTHKIRTKSLLRAEGIPTPDWFPLPTPSVPARDRTYILKPVCEDGSAGISDESVIPGRKLNREFLAGSKNGEFFLEEFIPGREFNLSVIGGNGGPRVLPPAEMKFLHYPEGKPRLLGYAAKWEEESFEYRNTVRQFELPSTDRNLVQNMMQIGLDCWRVFECRGYIRVDFRTDEKNRPWVIEINANPCISPDAGFPAACLQAGMNYREMISKIIQDIHI